MFRLIHKPSSDTGIKIHEKKYLYQVAFASNGEWDFLMVVLGLGLLYD